MIFCCLILTKVRCMVTDKHFLNELDQRQTIYVNKAFWTFPCKVSTFNGNRIDYLCSCQIIPKLNYLIGHSEREFKL